VGTALLARLGAKREPAEPRARALETGVVCLPSAGEEICGDAWVMDQRAGGAVVLVADGLGHGQPAAEAALEAVRVYQENPGLGPAEIMEAAHAALRHTRGAAVAVAELDTPRQLVRFAGVGNISGAILFSGGSRHMVSHNGTVGHEVHKIQQFTYPLSPEADGCAPLLVMHSDGLATRWSLDRYPGLAARHPGLIAGVLYRDYARGRDDLTVVAMRLPSNHRRS